MIVTDAGYGVERVFYTANGEPEVFSFGDAPWPAAAFVNAAKSPGRAQSSEPDLPGSLVPASLIA